MSKTLMRAEIEEIPAAVDRLLHADGPAFAGIAGAIKSFDPAFLGTIARGSSDHAAHFLKYAFEIELGLAGASLGPSLASVYGVVPRTSSAVLFAISQSGKSPDIVAMLAAARRGGGLTIALVNTLPSPLSEAAAHAIDLMAGPERSVAATKSFVCSVVAGLAILSELSDDPSLRTALRTFPARLAEALACDWTGLASFPESAESIYVLGRGPTSAIAHEVALKFKETCGIHAEAFSAAEVMQGPIERVETSFPGRAIAARDKAEPSSAAAADRLASQGARVFATSQMCDVAQSLPVPDAGHPLLNALAPIVPLYAFLESLSRKRGRNPDTPQRLRKVTETL